MRHRRLSLLIALSTLWAVLLLSASRGATAPCMTGSPAATATCVAGVSYGVTLTSSPIQFLGTEVDGTRNCIEIFADPGNGSNSLACIAKNVTASLSPIPNCIKLAPGQSYVLYNLPQGNSAPIVPNLALSGVCTSGNCNVTFDYCR